MFVGASDASEDDNDRNPHLVAKVIVDLQKRGNEKLAGHARKVYLDRQILTISWIMFDADYRTNDHCYFPHSIIFFQQI